MVSNSHKTHRSVKGSSQQSDFTQFEVHFVLINQGRSALSLIRARLKQRVETVLSDVPYIFHVYLPPMLILHLMAGPPIPTGIGCFFPHIPLLVQWVFSETIVAV